MSHDLRDKDNVFQRLGQERESDVCLRISDIDSREQKLSVGVAADSVR